MNKTVWLILFALLLDMIFGDPPGMPHPVRWIGSLIEKTEGFLRNTSLPEERSGWILALSVIFTVLFVSSYALSLAGGIATPVAFALEVWMVFTAVSLRSLRLEALKVKRALDGGSLADARRALSMIVGRETDNLSEKEIIRATVETVAENFVDGVLSPLFYTWIGGGPLALAYKAVNTLDSMVGYKNKKYLVLGRPSAIMDDAANFIPARISIPLLAAGAFFCRFDYRKAYRIGLRDRKKHPSPNSAHPEAAMAGALGIQLGGPGRYQGKVFKKAFLGENLVPLEKDHICQGLRLVEITTVVFAVMVLLWA